MFCESHREALNEAALSGEQLPTQLQAHLEVCVSCRAAFSEEKALFALMDAELQTYVNAEVPSSLLPRVRQEIAASPVARTWPVPVLGYVALGLVIGAMALSFVVRTKVSALKQEPPAGGLASAVSSDPIASENQRGLEQVFVDTSKKNRIPPQVVMHAEPEVLVSAEEQLGLQRYAASLRNTKAESPAVVKGSAAAVIEPLEIASVDVKRLSIEPLESGDSD